MPNPELPTLPEGQREIMEIVWDQGEVSVFEVREILGQTERSPGPPCARRWSAWKRKAGLRIA